MVSLEVASASNWSPTIHQFPYQLHFWKSQCTCRSYFGWNFLRHNYETRSALSWIPKCKNLLQLEPNMNKRLEPLLEVNVLSDNPIYVEADTMLENWKGACHDLWSPPRRFCQRFLTDIANFVKLWARFRSTDRLALEMRTFLEEIDSSRSSFSSRGFTNNFLPL